ncbi:hypothetical protein CC78DRAFT_371353 [Lojkania enalia]|uniref:Uncharacterized protein n=1 Tax=Lojkania enalia TaxID=147567 RepID=A0A9P4N3H9_9PLEO|nr:hypothetical protein CC78DRAFT_371353 [Didymosphaeria enalia]
MAVIHGLTILLCKFQNQQLRTAHDVASALAFAMNFIYEMIGVKWIIYSSRLYLTRGFAPWLQLAPSPVFSWVGWCSSVLSCGEV